MNKKQWDSIWIRAVLATCEPGEAVMPEAAVAVKDGKIVWLGYGRDLPGKPEALASAVYDAAGSCITPGLVDCHTHLIYAGNRAHEFEMRLNGMSYEDIARQGGGIQSTVTATRAASEAELLKQGLPRARALNASGVTTVEIKSGYGLDWETELKMLRVAKAIEAHLPLTVSKTFLGAHTIPVEYRGRSDHYVDLVCEQMLPKIAESKSAEAVDVFCETIAFNLEQTERIFKTARQYGLNVKCHSEQLSDSGSAALAAKYQALSVDHLEHVNEASVKAMAAAGTVAVLLPGAFYFLREKQLPPIEWLRQYKIPIAIASDCNPGTSPLTSMPMVMNMACTMFRLTPQEALQGATLHAARALGLADRIGSLSIGKAADFVVWNVNDPSEIPYYMGYAKPDQVVKNGAAVMMSLG